ncbi:DMT family transporter [Vibrio splendidus]|uniref:DMT family transporter n=1 Tax=Vibrio splendidus TaxID=29497 RepID=UPI00021C1946|nr:DMT family transporter [Vibrio splendidus]EGU42279.1 Permease of the drug metabolite transporter (DMT) superfamily protein [Vibrio splendidus ATCC 33789]|tara:strand:+ start:2260 stop:3189 length:930 start_codon:yes stop_codon:yes gene_type:complete
MKLGYLSITVTLLIWASFFLSLKGGANSNLTPADIALTRFFIPTLLLLPLVWKARNIVTAVPARYLLGMFIGSGLPYLLVAGTAMQFVPVSHGSALVPGTLPLFVTGIAVLFFKQPLSRHRVAGLAMVLFGIVLFLGASLSSLNFEYTKGHLLFLCGSLMWAIFTISARVANLNALVSAGFISLCSTLLLVLLIVTGTLPSHLADTPIAQWPFTELAVHSAVQGVGAGLIAAFTYLYAVKTLGAERSAAFGSATPAIATLLAIPLFGEIPDTLTWLALGSICIGSLVASNIFMRNDQSMQYQPPTHSKA